NPREDWLTRGSARGAARCVPDMQDHDLVVLNDIVNSIRVARRVQNSDLLRPGSHADVGVLSQATNAVAQVAADAIGGWWRNLCDVSADVAKVLNCALVPAQLHDQGLFRISSTSASEANSPRLALSSLGLSTASSSSESS